MTEKDFLHGSFFEPRNDLENYKRRLEQEISSLEETKSNAMQLQEQAEAFINKRKKHSYCVVDKPLPKLQEAYMRHKASVARLQDRIDELQTKLVRVESQLNIGSERFSFEDDDIHNRYLSR